MIDLTEQWKKGELPCGWHYIKIADIVFIDFFEGKVWKNKKDKYIDEVLAEVPSYEEWNKMNEELKDYEYEHKQYAMSYEDTFCKLETARKENKQLKELLKECRDVAEFTKTIVNKHKWLDDVITKINQALGEDK